MNSRFLAGCMTVTALIGPIPARAQTQAPADIRPAGPAARPVPYPVTPPPRFMHAVENGTRTVTGEPGPRYWQQRASYSIDARLDVEGRRLEGSAIVTYHNASPDTLPLILFKLYQNLHAVGAARHDPAEVTRGVALTRVAVNGNALRADRRQGAGYGVFGTRLGLWLEEPLAPGDSTVIEIDFAYDVPRVGAGGRMGWSDDNLFHLAYWYPQLAVFDDVVEWHADPFLGRAEFYAGFADYDVRIDVPEGWVVLGTGTLLNEEEVFPPLIRERIRRAEASDDVVQVLTADDFGPGRATVESPGGRLTWRLTADRVRDMAFSVTRESLWDAARTPVGDRDGDGSTDYARVDALYRAAATSWTNAARYAQHVIDFLSRDLGLPYPWPHMTVVEGDGIIGGGMEYPMVTLIGAYNGQPSQALYGVIAHELAHMWLPMTVNSDEVRWAWMDEGTTSFNTTQAATEFFPAFDHEAQEVQQYAGAAGAGFDGAMMRWTDWEYPDGWGIAAYAKPAAAMVALRYVLGDEVFDEAYRSYVSTWAWKHPKPWDFFHTFETVSGMELDWFWRGWFYETWTMDHAIARVESTRDGTRITVEDRGDLPMPATLTITREDGSVERHVVPVDRWLEGTRLAVVQVRRGSPVVQVELDAVGAFPDTDRANDVWRAGGTGD